MYELDPFIEISMVLLFIELFEITKRPCKSYIEMLLSEASFDEIFILFVVPQIEIPLLLSESKLVVEHPVTVALLVGINWMEKRPDTFPPGLVKVYESLSNKLMVTPATESLNRISWHASKFSMPAKDSVVEPLLVVLMPSGMVVVSEAV